jgi:hypothetical protein
MPRVEKILSERVVVQRFVKGKYTLGVLILAGLFIVSAFATAFNDGITYASAADGQYDWTERTVDNEANGWMYIAGSADGNKLAVADYYGYIYTSADGGATWTKRDTAGSRSWSAIASSADGTKLAAVANGGYIYTSSDSGATWTEHTAVGTRTWVGVTVSGDGTTMAATASSGSYIYTSTDGGANWTERTSAGARYWSYITSSADGTKLAAIGNDNTNTVGYIYTSSDSGVTWTERTAAGLKKWNSITMSADGTKMASGVSSASGYLYTSDDSGSTWTEQTGAGSGGWYSVIMSANGNRLIALHNSSIQVSSNDGITWVEQSIADAADWSVMAISADGAKIAAASYDPPLFTGSIDLDTDPISDTIEAAAPNDGDGNYDGVADAEQANVTSFVNPITNEYVTLVSTGSGEEACNFTSAAITASSENEAVDAAYQYPFGFVNFTTQCGNNGASAHIEIYVHNATSASYVARKYNASTKQYSDMPSGANVHFDTSNNALILSYDITDGSSLDEDGAADGSIIDPIGIGSTASQVLAPNTGLSYTSPALMLITIASGLGILTGLGLIMARSSRLQ